MNSTVSDYRENTKDEHPTQPQKMTKKKKQEQQEQHQSRTTSTTTTTAFAPAPAPAPASVDGKKKKNKSNIRYAERRRTSTCLFADRVAQVSVDTYKSLISESERPPQTCIATIVAHYRGRRHDDDDVCGASNDDDDDDDDGDDPTGGESSTSSRNNRKRLLRVISLGVGTKFLPESILKSEIMNSNHNNKDHHQNKNDRETTTTPSASRSSASSCDEIEYREEEDGQRQRQDKNDLPYGCRVRDLHAEILARRAFRRYLTTEILHDISNDGISEDDKKKQNRFSVLVRSNSTTKGDDDSSGCDESNHSSNNDGVGDNNDNSSSSNSSSNNKNVKVRHKYKLRPGVTLHLYTSSAPCGNATLKRFCKMSKEKFRDDLGDDEWPDQKLQASSVNSSSSSSSHQPFFGHSKKLGEFSLLIKKDSNSAAVVDNDVALNRNLPNARRCNDSSNNGIDNLNDGNRSKIESGDSNSWDELVSNGKKRSRSTATTDENNDVEVPPSSSSNGQPSIPYHTEDNFVNNSRSNSHSSNNKSRRRKPKLWPADQSDDWTPPGTTIVGFHDKGSIHTCSDKILRWNVLGLQGSLLSCILDEPLYLSTLTVGRKLSGAVCRRALCCRLGSGPFVCLPVATSESTNKNSSDGQKPSDSRRQEEERRERDKHVYHLNHPSIMGTGVYLDETGVVETNSEIHGQDVRFHSSSSWAWWNIVEDSPSSTGGSLECIDGSTGFLVASDTKDDDHDGPKKSSLVSTQELTTHFLKVYNKLSKVGCADVELADRGNNEIGSTTERNDFSTLSELLFLKKQVSPVHEGIKDYVFENDRVLFQWRRR